MPLKQLQRPVWALWRHNGKPAKRARERRKRKRPRAKRRVNWPNFEIMCPVGSLNLDRSWKSDCELNRKHRINPKKWLCLTMAVIGRVQGKGLTPEAEKALREQGSELDDIDSVADDSVTEAERLLHEPYFGPPLSGPDNEDGDSIDDSRLRQRPQAPPPPREAKATIPSIDEWQDFFARIVLRVACDWYINWAFRGVDEDSITDRELDRLQMTDEERSRISVPLAEISHKSKIMRRHGRAIVASGGLFDALVALGTWTSRVNRVARRHKPLTGKVVNGERNRQNPPAGAREESSASANGNGGYTVFNPGGG